MTDAQRQTRPAVVDDRERIVALLDANDLPSEDVWSEQTHLFVATDGSDIVGIVGLEVCGTHGLLRSLAVLDSHRGQGYGTTLCETVEEHARANGLDALYLLTTTAAAFFERRGYEAIDRGDAPSAIRQTTEFAEICPQSAACLSKEFE